MLSTGTSRTSSPRALHSATASECRPSSHTKSPVRTITSATGSRRAMEAARQLHAHCTVQGSSHRAMTSVMGLCLPAARPPPLPPGWLYARCCRVSEELAVSPRSPMKPKRTGKPGLGREKDFSWLHPSLSLPAGGGQGGRGALSRALKAAPTWLKRTKAGLIFVLRIRCLSAELGCLCACAGMARLAREASLCKQGKKLPTVPAPRVGMPSQPPAGRTDNVEVGRARLQLAQADVVQDGAARERRLELQRNGGQTGRQTGRQAGKTANRRAGGGCGHGQKSHL